MSTDERAAELGLLRLADASASDLLQNERAIQRGTSTDPRIEVVTWFLPIVSHALKGGVRTVFILAESFSKRWGTLNHFVLDSYTGRDVDTQALCDSLREYFPALHFTVDVFRRGLDHIRNLPPSNASFCTLWTTAYLQLKYNQTARKYYLVQDFEPSFYQAGGIYGVIEQTYRFGFSCIANTEGVGNRCRQYTNDVTVFTPGVDRVQFCPDPAKTAIGKPARVVFYGRPGNPRNCFILGTEILRSLKRKMGKKVEIISVGADWSESDFDLEGILTNWGLLGSMKEVADLYRSADLGLVFMMTPHPSYQPFEYMASGCVTATNINEANQWLLKPDNSLLLPPVAELAAQQIKQLLNDPHRWSALRLRALECVAELDWQAAVETVIRRVGYG